MPCKSPIASSKPESLPGGRSTWVGSPVTIILLSSPSRVRNILICTGVQFCASSRMMMAWERVRPRMKANAALHPLRRKHVIQGVVERPQIRIDLLAHVAGKEAEALACLNRGARQDQPVASAAFETDSRERHREIGLAGAGGTGGEDEVITLQR